MPSRSTALHEAFLEDHKQMMRGLAGLRKALQADDLPRARELADTLDRRVGPHIEFEEKVFYPELLDILGREFVHQLYREHTIGQQALKQLLEMDTDAQLEAPARDELIEQIDATLEHAFSCGTLLSHVSALDSRHQENLLAQLQAMRSRNHRWTELRARKNSQS